MSCISLLSKEEQCILLGFLELVFIMVVSILEHKTGGVQMKCLLVENFDDDFEFTN